MVVGIPLAAAHMLGSHVSTSHCFSSLAMDRVGQRQKFARSAGVEEMLARLQKLLDAMQSELALAVRGVFLFLLFLPVLAAAPVGMLGDEYRSRWYMLLRWTLENAGPAFIKWGQWAATRPDLFPQEFCSCLAALQTSAPRHSYAETRRALESAFGIPMDRLFLEFDPEPVASGSIAQVHKARLTDLAASLCGQSGMHTLQKKSARAGPAGPLGGGLSLSSMPRNGREQRQKATFLEGTTVAVKVRHPGVTEMMEKDFILMQRAVSMLSLFPGLGLGPQLKESLMQFGAPMREQLDLRTEAKHLAKFADNFRWWSGVRFPLPASESMVAPNVLIESFEEGQHISEYLKGPCPHNKILAGLGVSCYLKMLLRDNYIHADLHPGNILVRVEGPPPGSFMARMASAFGIEVPKLPRLVLLDVGMTARLTSDDQKKLVGFFKSLTNLDGAAVADAILRFAEPLHHDARSGSQEILQAGSERMPPSHADYRQETGKATDVGISFAGDSFNTTQQVGPFSKNLNGMVTSSIEAASDEGNVNGDECKAVASFREEMAVLFSKLDPETLRQNTSEVMAEMMDTIRRHGVHIRGVVSTVVITSMVLEGWSSKLDPDVRILETLKRVLPSAWSERMSTAMDKVLSSNSLALV